MAQSKSFVDASHALNDLSHALALLESENARLLDDNTHLQEIVTDDELHMRKVLEENARLRELCTDLYDHAAYSIDHFGDVHGILPRMSELWLEVG